MHITELVNIINLKEMNENEEIECRVCRGGADDRPLYSPCKCSGSVGM